MPSLEEELLASSLLPAHAATQAARSGHGKFAHELRDLVDQVAARSKVPAPTIGAKPVRRWPNRGASWRAF